MHHRRRMFLDMGRKEDDDFAASSVTSRAFFSERLANGQYRAWMVESATGQIIAGAGVIIFDYHSSPLDPTPKRPMVVNVYTDPSHRRQGIARKLMELIVEWCRLEGFGSILLHASDEGRPLYESMGFKTTNEMRLMLR
jgi:GNAT superfamily N-acetyltransferase